MSPRQHPGAPRGNQNARKHGLRSLQDPAFPAADPLLDFKTEISRLRAHNSRLIDQLETTTDPDQLTNLHRSIDICTLSILRLTRMHLSANPADVRQQQAINNMSSLMRQVLALKEPDDATPESTS